MLPVILICAFMVKNAATQPVNATLGTTKPCVLIGDEVKLLCTVSSGCCTSSARVWEKGSGSSILNDGISTDSSKYVEDYDNGTTGFNLIIKNVQKSDFGLNYKCRYGVISSNELYLDNILCPSSEVNISGSSSELNISGNCWECAGKDYGWSILGDVIGTVIIMIIVIVKIGKTKTVLIVGGLTFIISAVVNLFALLIGYYTCHCVDGTDPWLILLGLVTSGIIGVIVLNCVPTVKVPRSSYVVTTGKAMILECTVTSCLPITSVQWQRNVGGSKTTINSNTIMKKHAGSTATAPSLTIYRAASSDAGTYICFASNCVGTGQSTTITVAKQDPASGSSQGSNGSNKQPLNGNKKKKPSAEKNFNDQPLEEKKEDRSRSPPSGTNHIKTANNELVTTTTEKGFSGDLEKKKPLPPLTNQPSPTNRPLPLPSSTRPLPQITTNKGDN